TPCWCGVSPKSWPSPIPSTSDGDPVDSGRSRPPASASGRWARLLPLLAALRPGRSGHGRASSPRPLATVNTMAERLALDQAGNDAFVSRLPADEGHVFGGLLVGQALRAATRTVAPAR